LIVCLGLVVNAVVCSVPATHDRYQTRVVWLIPLSAMLLYLQTNPRVSQQSAT
jgi:hypothetical protein